MRIKTTGPARYGSVASAEPRGRRDYYALIGPQRRAKVSHSRHVDLVRSSGLLLFYRFSFKHQADVPEQISGKTGA